MSEVSKLANLCQHAVSDGLSKSFSFQFSFQTALPSSGSFFCEVNRSLYALPIGLYKNHVFTFRKLCFDNSTEQAGENFMRVVESWSEAKRIKPGYPLSWLIWGSFPEMRVLDQGQICGWGRLNCWDTHLMRKDGTRIRGNKTGRVKRLILSLNWENRRKCCWIKKEP